MKSQPDDDICINIEYTGGPTYDIVKRNNMNFIKCTPLLILTFWESVEPCALLYNGIIVYESHCRN